MMKEAHISCCGTSGKIKKRKLARGEQEPTLVVDHHHRHLIQQREEVTEIIKLCNHFFFHYTICFWFFFFIRPLLVKRGSHRNVLFSSFSFSRSFFIYFLFFEAFYQFFFKVNSAHRRSLISAACETQCTKSPPTVIQELTR